MSNIGIKKNNYKKILVDTIPKQKPPKEYFLWRFLLVGAAGFEPATLCSQSKRRKYVSS